VGQVSERHHGLHVCVEKHGVEPLVAVLDDLRVLLVALATALAEHRVEERVQHHVALGDPQLPQEALHALAGLAHQDPPADRLVLAGVLAQHQDLSAAV
jgi:hypothetical protein